MSKSIPRWVELILLKVTKPFGIFFSYLWSVLNEWIIKIGTIKTGPIKKSSTILFTYRFVYNQNGRVRKQSWMRECIEKDGFPFSSNWPHLNFEGYYLLCMFFGNPNPECFT